MHASRICRQALYPLLVFSQTVPTVLLAPILVVAFGFGLTPKLVVIAIVCFFPIVVNTYDGLRSTDADLARMLKTLHGTRWIAFRKLEVPTALPALFSGARVAATYAAVAAVFAEWTGSQGGLGYVMLQAGPSLETETVVAAVLILAVMALALGGAVSLAQRLIAPWSVERRDA
jgi:putative hydroxymethylpyrimidine transport system permease protein